MQLTKEEAIKRHRMMWNWIAEETLRQECCIIKKEAFEHFGWGYVPAYCWCCEYDNEHNHDCSTCPIKWPSKASFAFCTKYYEYEYGGLYDIWYTAAENNDCHKAALYAKRIAELPENPNT